MKKLLNIFSLVFWVLFSGMAQADFSSGMGGGVGEGLSIVFLIILGLNALILLYVFFRCAFLVALSRAFLVALLHLLIVAAIFFVYGFLMVYVIDTSKMLILRFVLCSFFVLVFLPAWVAHLLIRKKKREKAGCKLGNGSEQKDETKESVTNGGRES